MEATGVWPAFNELEYHPYVSSATKELVRWCQQKEIVVIAYGSLGGSANRAKVGGAVASIARARNVSTARVLLRWAVQHGVVVIPGATSEAHIRDNLALLQADPPALELSREETARIDGDSAGAVKTFKRWKGLCADGAGSSAEAECKPSV